MSGPKLTQEITWHEYTGMLDTAPDDTRMVLVATSLANINNVRRGWFDWQNLCWRNTKGKLQKPDEVLYWAEMPTHPDAEGT